MIQPNIDISSLSSQSSMNRLESLASSRTSEKEIDMVAGEFQSMCYANLVKSMFLTTQDSALWGDSHAAGILRSMFIDALSHSGGAESLNIRASIKKSLYTSMGLEKNSEASFPNSQQKAAKELDDQKKGIVNVLL